jgi:hypothetical protein
MLSRRLWSQLPSVLQPEQLQDQVHHGVLLLHGLVSPPVLQRVHICCRLWPGAHRCPMVQRHDQRALLVQGVRGGAGGLLPGQHDPAARHLSAEGQGLPLVGQVPELQDGQPQRGVLLPALQPQQVLPVRVILILLLGWRIGSSLFLTTARTGPEKKNHQ